MCVFRWQPVSAHRHKTTPRNVLAAHLLMFHRMELRRAAQSISSSKSSQSTVGFMRIEGCMCSSSTNSYLGSGIKRVLTGAISIYIVPDGPSRGPFQFILIVLKPKCIVDKKFGLAISKKILNPKYFRMLTQSFNYYGFFLVRVGNMRYNRFMAYIKGWPYEQSILWYKENVVPII